MPLSVEYAGTPLRLGTQLEPGAVLARPPTMSLAGAPSGARFVLALIAPDVPSPKTPTERSRLLWLLFDATAAAAPRHELDLGAARILVPYSPPNPLMGNQRFVFCALRQAGGAPPPPLDAPPRTNFSLVDFAARNKLIVSGVNFFCAHAKESWGSGGGGAAKKRRRKD